jgi:hypothetical protein
MRTKKAAIGRGMSVPPPRAAELKQSKSAPAAARPQTTPSAKRAAMAAKRPAQAKSRKLSQVLIAADAQLLRVEPGLHSLAVTASESAPRALAGMTLPAVLVTAPYSGAGDAVELIGARGGGTWIDAAGSTVMLRAPAGGGYVLLTSYNLPGEAAIPLGIELRPADAAAAAPPASGGPALRAEIALHIEREGDRQFTAGGWAGRLGSRLRIEALAVRPLEAITRGEVEYKVYSTGGRETPWVTDGRLCGTRGQGLPLTGFAVRLAPHLRNGFDVIYRGAFFASGPAPAARNGDACFAPLRDDPLEAVEIRIVERGGAQ